MDFERQSASVQTALSIKPWIFLEHAQSLDPHLYLIMNILGGGGCSYHITCLSRNLWLRPLRISANLGPVLLALPREVHINVY